MACISIQRRGTRVLAQFWAANLLMNPCQDLADAFVVVKETAS